MSTFIFTCGDINGIGPEITVKALNYLHLKSDNSFIFICPEQVFLDEYSNTVSDFKYEVIDSIENIKPLEKQIKILSIPEAGRQLGWPTKSSGKVSFESIQKSYTLLENKIADAVITAPISKEAIKLAGINFPGHTEMYADWCGEKNYVMMFLADRMKTALVTIHEPIGKVSALITKSKIENTLKTVSNSLLLDLGITNPEIAVLGLNPHAGENGNIGTEENEVIAPAISESRNINADGPFVPDAFFGKQIFEKYDAVIGMYHDQVLIPFKMLNFHTGVNYTAGLPIVRTSPDHGTAFNIAGKGIANAESMIEAFKWAEIIVSNRKARNEK